jgi:hypothetical protein
VHPKPRPLSTLSCAQRHSLDTQPLSCRWLGRGWLTSRAGKQSECAYRVVLSCLDPQTRDHLRLHWQLRKNWHVCPTCHAEGHSHDAAAGCLPLCSPPCTGQRSPSGTCKHWRRRVCCSRQPGRQGPLTSTASRTPRINPITRVARYYYYYMVYSTAREPCRWPLTNLVASKTYSSTAIAGLLS